MGRDYDPLTYVPLLVRSDLVNDWERKFCISIAGRMKRGATVLTKKQEQVLVRLADRFRDAAFGGLLEGGDDDSGR